MSNHNHLLRCGAYGGVTGWTPASLPGLAPTILPGLSRSRGLLWQDAAKTVPAVANNDPVRVATCPFTGVDWTASAAGTRPLLNTDGVGHWWFTFDGADDRLVSAAFSCGSNCSLYFRLMHTSATAGGFFDSAPSVENVLRSFPAGAGAWDWWNAAPSVALGTTQNAWGTLSFLHSLNPARNIDYRRNGSAVSSNPNASTDPAAWLSPCVGIINNDSAANNPFAGRIAGVIPYTGTHTTAQAALVEAYLAAVAF